MAGSTFGGTGSGSTPVKGVDYWTDEDKAVIVQEVLASVIPNGDEIAYGTSPESVVSTNGQYYADIAAAIRQKNGTTVQYYPSEMAGAILGLESGIQNTSTIIVTAPTGSTITLTCGDETRTTFESNGTWTFLNCGIGEYTINAVSSDENFNIYKIINIIEYIQQYKYYINIEYTNVYGISRDITSSNPAWTRTDESATFTATASVGSTAGYSDFDDCYPWSEMKRETLSTGDVIVKIPKFWYRRYREGNIEYIKIADNDGSVGYKIHPAFNHGEIESDCIYVGAYKTSTAPNASISGATIRFSGTKNEFRTMAIEKGEGWGIVDISTLSAIQMLYLVEFATFDSQSVIGKGYVDLSQYAGSPTKTGSTDAVTNLTGMPTGTDGEVDIVWRGIEGLWGSAMEFVDGVLFDCTNMLYYVSNNPDKYVSNIVTDYTALSYPIPISGKNNQYITALGLDSGDNDHILLPSAAGTVGGSTGLCDVMSSSSSNIKMMKRGGHWYSIDKAGLFMVDGTSSSNDSDKYTGFRLMYIPQNI